MLATQAVFSAIVSLHNLAEITLGRLVSEQSNRTNLLLIAVSRSFEQYAHALGAHTSTLVQSFLCIMRYNDNSRAFSLGMLVKERIST